ncbi:uncharacterized protein (TIGR03083 family) [Brevibacterium sanguinis]|uniref:Uncharacterized protein (TIGR03083 family) n=2 Tax=Brevibacterium TaxID=1696 RepID=A0A366IP72_9MICO|nr:MULTISPECIES: maleylpyruvate isomerase family mycothiol-dependent enzyme [Brevibacterium]RBP67934.1 uncharacterized protein (TIGR03083 family) [Brevibacterium sanguinis]RBP74649.1 uncharacterized protein (TIGR03083 family) [Brevibacterium celere]
MTATWNAIHAERARLATLLDDLTAEQWRARSLCAEWTVEDVVAHLSAAASTTTLRWLVSIAGAGFNADRHNARALSRHLGDDPAATLAEYRRTIPLTIAPTKDLAAFLGEVIVHGQDIAQPLGIALVPNRTALSEVAEFYAARDFAVNSRTLVKGLRLEADDADFATGEGPLVRGGLLALVMAMAGRDVSLDCLEGDGVEELKRRLGGSLAA